MHVLKSYLKQLVFGKPASSQSPTIIEIIKQLSQGKASVVFDIGAHQGNYARELSSQIRIDNCFCFEPFESSFQALHKNLIGDEFQLFQIALSDYEGVSDFYVNSFDETNSLLPSVKTNSSIDDLIAPKSIVSVTVETLDGFCSKKGITAIDLLKIDTQGNTFAVLNGGKNLLKNKMINLIQCEVEFVEIYKQEQLYHKIATFLENYDYQLYSIYNLHFDINNRLSWGDALFIKNDSIHKA
jgi:FkbM family methyltransferase